MNLLSNLCYSMTINNDGIFSLKELKKCMMKELYTEILSLIIFWLEVLSQLKIAFLLLILGLQSATKIPMESISLIVTVKIWQELPVMRVLIHTRVWSSHEGTTLKPLDTFYYTYWEEACPGRVFQEEVRMKNIATLRKRKLRQPWKNYAEGTHLSFKSSWSIVGRWSLNRTPTIST